MSEIKADLKSCMYTVANHIAAERKYYVINVNNERGTVLMSDGKKDCTELFAIGNMCDLKKAKSIIETTKANIFYLVCPFSLSECLSEQMSLQRIKGGIYAVKETGEVVFVRHSRHVNDVFLSEYMANKLMKRMAEQFLESMYGVRSGK